jgi:hypothetical protein
MHKKIESELVSLAHSILQMKNSDDILKLKEKAGQVYEKLSVLAFVDRYAQSNPEASKETLIASLFQSDIQKSEIATQKKKTEVVSQEVVAPKSHSAEVISAVQESEVVESNSTEVKPATVATPIKKTGLEELIKEVKDVDPYAEEDLFSRKVAETVTKEATEEVQKEVKKENKRPIEKEVPVETTAAVKDLQDAPVSVAPEIFETTEPLSYSRKTINDTVIKGNLQIGLNDRIAFVKHLFEGSQQDFNRVVSQLNSFKYEKEAIEFVMNMVKLDYDWSGKEAYEERFISLITRKFA